MDPAQEAISAALSGDWKKAIELNYALLRNDSGNVDTLNRIAKAYAELGKLAKASSISRKVLKLDPFNKIATRSLSKWKKSAYSEEKFDTVNSAQAFLEEPGKTKIVNLIHLGDDAVIAQLDPGDEMKLSTTKHRVSVITPSGKYVGRLPDDLSARLNYLVKNGGKYLTLIKFASRDKVKVFIRETEKSKKLKDLPSFPSEKITYVAFTPPELVHEKQLSNIDTLSEN